MTAPPELAHAWVREPPGGCVWKCGREGCDFTITVVVGDPTRPPTGNYGSCRGKVREIKRRKTPPFLSSIPGGRNALERQFDPRDHAPAIVPAYDPDAVVCLSCSERCGIDVIAAREAGEKPCQLCGALTFRRAAAPRLFTGPVAGDGEGRRVHDGISPAALPALGNAPNAGGGLATDGRGGFARTTAGDHHATDRAAGRAVADADGAALPRGERRPDADVAVAATVAGIAPALDARGIPRAAIGVEHVRRIRATLRVAGVCACNACVTFAVVHETDVLPLLAPAIAGRRHPLHGSTGDQNQTHEKTEKPPGVSHDGIVTRPPRGKK